MIELEIKVTKKQTADTGLISMSVQGLNTICFGHMIRTLLDSHRYVEPGIMIVAENIVRKERRRYMRFDESGQAHPGEFYDTTYTCKSYVIPHGSTIKFKSSLCKEYEAIKLKTYQDMLLAINKLDLLVTLENT